MLQYTFTARKELLWLTSAVLISVYFHHNEMSLLKTNRHIVQSLTERM
jgi:hypothetical protein